MNKKEFIIKLRTCIISLMELQNYLEENENITLNKEKWQEISLTLNLGTTTFMANKLIGKKQ